MVLCALGGDDNAPERAVCARVVEESQMFRLPDDPVLAAWASALNNAGHWAILFDAAWRHAFATDELRLTWGRSAPIGAHFFSTTALQFRESAIGGSEAVAEYRRATFLRLGGYVLASTAGGREELREVVDPEFADLVDDIQPEDVPPVWGTRTLVSTAEVDVGASTMLFRIDDTFGNIAGICMLLKPAAGMSHLAAVAATADLSHLERMQSVTRPARHPAAILMADLEASSPLARRLSTAQYFAFARRLVRAADQCIVEFSGIVGRHAGDGVVAFFLVDTTGSESAAAYACIGAARALRDAIADVAARSEIPESDLSLRFGLHWGATLYIGRISTVGRSEVTALGDEINETARIEASAAGGRMLASKSLIERLNHDDATALGLDPARTNYTRLGDLDSATDKARRDAPTIPVYDIANATR